MGGCIMIPVPTSENKVLAGNPITEEQMTFLIPHVTTQQEVVEQLGQPVVVWEDARLFVYNWKMRQGILFWAVGGASQGAMTGGGGMKDIPKHYLLLIKFDEKSRIQRFERAVCPISKTYLECLKAWERKSSEGFPVDVHSSE
jgi:hypothetical protein